jgi:hypothetical protein
VSWRGDCGVAEEIQFQAVALGAKTRQKAVIIAHFVQISAKKRFFLLMQPGGCVRNLGPARRGRVEGGVGEAAVFFVFWQ